MTHDENGVVVATVGTTSSGAIDHIGEIGDIGKPLFRQERIFSESEPVATMPSLWLHIDAAWAGVALACPEYRDLCFLDDINKYADSFCTNFPKASYFI